MSKILSVLLVQINPIVFPGNPCVRSEDKLQDIKNKLPIRTSNPQVIDWLIEIGQKQIQGAINDNTSRIPK